MTTSLMKYMDRIKKRKIFQQICRFLKYIDYITQNLLNNLIVRGSKSLLLNLEAKNAIPSAMFSIQISLNDHQLTINPEQIEVEDSLREMIEKSFLVGKIKRFQEKEDFQKFTR